jgi:hypothetical protein
LIAASLPGTCGLTAISVAPSWVQLLLVVTQRDVAGGTAREAEEEQYHRPGGEQLRQLDGAAEHLGQRERLDDVADLHERVAVGGRLEQPPLVDVGLQVRRGHRL